jgi:probable phosphoglycerate mutase
MMAEGTIMKAYFIRHGQSVANQRREMAGWAQVPLSQLGHEQARSLAPYLAPITFDKIISSDLPRAVQTAQDAIEGCLPELSSKIREIDVGHISGLPHTVCIERYGEKFIADNLKQDFSAYGGEDQKAMSQRVFEFIRGLEVLEPLENVAIFCHEGTVHQMFNYVFKTHIEISSLRVANASVTVFSYEKGTWKLVAFSFTGKI